MRNAVDALNEMLAKETDSQRSATIRELLTVALRWSDNPPTDNLDDYLEASDHVAKGIRALLAERVWGGRVDWEEPEGV